MSTSDISRTQPQEGDLLRNAQMYQLVEALLGFTRRDGSAAALAAALQEGFDSPLCMFTASRQVLENCGLNPGEALLFSRMTDLARCCQTGRFPKQPLLGKIHPAAQYLCAHFFYLPVERFHALCLDRQGRMMEMLCLQEGTEDGALLSLRRLLREVMRVQPSAIVLSHNHPGGTLSPSQEDIECTRSVIRALSAIGVPVLDHLILVRGAAVSLRANGFIPELQWLKQATDSSLLRDWLEGADLRQAALTNLMPPPFPAREE